MEEIKRKERWLLTNTTTSKWQIPVLIGLGLVSCVLIACVIWQYNRAQKLESRLGYYSRELSAKASEEKERERKLEALKEKLDSTEQELKELASEFPIRITGIMLDNSRKDNTIVNEKTSIIYGGPNWDAGSVYYISPTLKLFAYKSGNLDIAYKIYRDGKLSYNSSISSVFSGRLKTVNLSKGENTVELSGWGNDSGTSYQAGEYQIEVWTQGKCYGRYSFQVR